MGRQRWLSTIPTLTLTAAELVASWTTYPGTASRLAQLRLPRSARSAPHHTEATSSTPPSSRRDGPPRWLAGSLEIPRTCAW
jgi:hypothetical protein